MNYVVVADNGIDNQEHDFYLPNGYEFTDGEFEPDLVAQWVAAGWIESPDAPAAEPRKRGKSSSDLS